MTQYDTDYVSPLGKVFKLVESLFKPESTNEPEPEDTAHERDYGYVPEHQETYEGDDSPDDYAGDGIAPIPVRVVTDDVTVEVEKGAAWFTSAHHIIRSAANAQQGGGQLVSSRDLRKRAVTIVNNGSDFIVVGSSPTLFVSANGSGRIKAGQSLTLDTCSDVYLLANTDQMDVEVFQEFEYGGGD